MAGKTMASGNRALCSNCAPAELLLLLALDSQTTAEQDLNLESSQMAIA